MNVDRYVEGVRAGDRVAIGRAITLVESRRDDIMIVVGGVIPPSDYDILFKEGAKAVFGPGTNIPVAAADLLDKLNVQMGYGPKVAAE